MKGVPRLDPSDLAELLKRFYGRVRSDAELGPVFNETVHDWSEHLDRMSDFWSSVMTGSGRYKGNPVVMHLLHGQRFTPGMFDRWLQLWEQTTTESLPTDVAKSAQAKARRIAGSLQLAIRSRNPAG